jgi:hypothetical protein
VDYAPGLIAALDFNPVGDRLRVVPDRRIQ